MKPADVKTTSSCRRFVRVKRGYWSYRVIRLFAAMTI